MKGKVPKIATVTADESTKTVTHANPIVERANSFGRSPIADNAATTINQFFQSTNFVIKPAIIETLGMKHVKGIVIVTSNAKSALPIVAIKSFLGKDSRMLSCT